MTPSALEIAPAPLHASAGRRLENVTFQGARVQMELHPDGYSVQLDGARQLTLYPPHGYRAIEVNRDGNIQPVWTLTTTPGVPYVIRAHR
jgi:hypothetical protein